MDITQTTIAIIDKSLGFIAMGGPNSGHWGHAGRKGKRGGSAPGKGIRVRLPTIDTKSRLIPKDYRDQLAHETKAVLQKLPSAHTRELREVRFRSDKQFTNETGLEPPKFGVAYYHGKTNTIYHLGRNIGEGSAIAHEVGHHTWRKVMNNSQQNLWEAKWRMGAGIQKGRGKTFPEESFADTYAAHFLKLESLDKSSVKFLGLLR